jgi:hypothetical protein
MVKTSDKMVGRTFLILVTTEQNKVSIGDDDDDDERPKYQHTHVNTGGKRERNSDQH